MSTVLILGTKRSGCRPLRYRRRSVTGIRWTDREYVYILSPLFDQDGNQSPEIPEFPPAEIRELSHDLPDLTAEYLGEVRAEYDALQTDSREMNSEQLCQRYGIGKPTPANLEETELHRKRNLARSFKDYRKG